MKSIYQRMIGIAAPIFMPIVVAHAQSQNKNLPDSIQSWPQVMQAICSFIGYFFWIIIALSTIMVIVAAYNYVTAQDDTEKTSKARRTLTYAAVGVAVALCAAAFPMIVSSVFGQQSAMQITCSAI